MLEFTVCKFNHSIYIQAKLSQRHPIVRCIAESWCLIGHSQALPKEFTLVGGPSGLLLMSSETSQTGRWGGKWELEYSGKRDGLKTQPL